MTEQLHFHFSLSCHWRRKWQPTPVFLPGESQGWGSLVGCCLWGRTESDTTEATQQQQQQQVKTFLPGSKRLLISWLQSPSAVILEPPKIKSATVYTVSPSICHEVMGADSIILVFTMEYYSATKRDEILIHVTKQMNLEIILLSERSQM